MKKHNSCLSGKIPGINGYGYFLKNAVDIEITP